MSHVSGVEDVAETLEELWISYNLLTNLKGLEKLVCGERERKIHLES